MLACGKRETIRVLAQQNWQRLADTVDLIVDPAALVNHVLPYQPAVRTQRLREAHDLCGLPVSVLRCDMLMADTSYAGQLNVPEMFTRMMLSLVATGVAPACFCELDAGGSRQRAHFDGLPVEFIADAISTLGVHMVDGFETYHVMNPYDDGIGMDTFVDWLEAARRVAVAAVAQLPKARTPRERVTGPGGSLQGGGAGSQDRAGQGHPPI